MIDQYESSFNQVAELKNETIRSLLIGFIKHITSVSVILIPLTSFLHPDQPNDKELFHCLLIALSMCILSGVANLYIVLIQHRKLAADLIEEIQKSIQARKKVEPVYGKYNFVMIWSERVCVLSFLAALGFIVLLSW